MLPSLNNTSLVSILSLVVSSLALLVSGVSLGWNIYRDVILKARLRVSFNLTLYIKPDGSTTPPFLKLTVVNMGPGEAVVNMAMAKKRVSRFGRTWLGTANPNFNDPYCARLPAKIGVSETIGITFPIGQNCLLDESPLRIGVQDSFGRIHWAPRRDLVKSRRDLEEHKAGRPWY